MERPICKTCPYWKRDEVLRSIGECRRHSPPAGMAGEIRHSETNAPFRASWAKTLTDDWCGEHPGFPAYLESLKTTPSPEG